MKLVCSDCGREMFKKDIGREHHDARTGETTYRCRTCAEARVAALIERTKNTLGIFS